MGARIKHTNCARCGAPLDPLTRSAVKTMRGQPKHHHRHFGDGARPIDYVTATAIQTVSYPLCEDCRRDAEKLIHDWIAKKNQLPLMDG